MKRTWTPKTRKAAKGAEENFYSANSAVFRAFRVPFFEQPSVMVLP